MNKYKHLKEAALKWRAEGLALDDIAHRLSLNRTTVYYWIKGIEIPRTKKQSDAMQRRAQAHVQKYADKRQMAYEEGVIQADDLFQEHGFRDFIVIYLTEGYRRSRNQVAVCNSNVNIIKLAYMWIKKLAKNKLGYSLQCHVDNDEEELKIYWANHLGIEKEKIKVIRKSNSGELSGRNWRSTHGVFSVRANDTYLRSKIQAWMDLLQKEWERAVA